MNLSTVKWAKWGKTHSRELLGPFICVCIALCTIVAHNIAQNRHDNFPSYPPDNHHCSDDVYLREEGCILVAGEPFMLKLCSADVKEWTFFWFGCKTRTFRGLSANVCVCRAHLCNLAAMTSSFSHVITSVALLVGIIAVRLVWTLPGWWWRRRWWRW